jgi:hypothetical protein
MFSIEVPPSVRPVSGSTIEYHITTEKALFSFQFSFLLLHQRFPIRGERNAQCVIVASSVAVMSLKGKLAQNRPQGAEALVVG